MRESNKVYRILREHGVAKVGIDCKSASPAFPPEWVSCLVNRQSSTVNLLRTTTTPHASTTYSVGELLWKYRGNEYGQ